MAKKSVILGCGPRAGEHVRAYEGIDDAVVAAACDADSDRLKAFGERFGIEALYADMGEMLRAERPDVLHIITPPAVRIEPMELAAEIGVKGVILEKPLGLDLSEVRRVAEIASEAGMKVAANMQRRYFGTCERLKVVLDEGRIGQIEFIRCVTRGNILIMGSHLVDLLLYFLGDVQPARAWATAVGVNGYDNGHQAPAHILAQLNFPDDVTAYIEDAEDAVGTRGEGFLYHHLELDFWGTSGRAWWTQNRDWGYQSHDMDSAVVEESIWANDHIEGQRQFTLDLLRWLDDDSVVHRNRLDVALTGYDVIAAVVQSALEGRRIDLPAEAPGDILTKARAELA